MILGILIFVTVVLLLTAGLCLGIYYQRRYSKKDLEELAYYKRTMLRRQGYLKGFGHYELLSFDGGKQWYAVERSKSRGIFIEGPVEKVFPGLMEALRGWDALNTWSHCTK